MAATDTNTEQTSRPDDASRGPVLTYDQSTARMAEVHAELARLNKLGDLSPENELLFDQLTREFVDLDAHRKRLMRAADLSRVGTVANGLLREKGSPVPVDAKSGDIDRDVILNPDSIEEHRFRNPWDLSDVRTFGRPNEEVGAEFRARAIDAISKMPAASDRVREAGTKILEGSDDKQSTLARQVLVTSSPAYLRAWSKMARNEQTLLTPEESRALAAVRAMSLTDANGGYLVPFQLDPTVIITSAGSRNDIRQFARQVVAVGDKWHGVAAGAVSWSWDAEAAEVSDDAPAFAQPDVPVHTARGFVPISIEALEDEANATAEVARLLAFGKDELEAAAFVNGSGIGQPTGLITGLTGTAAEVDSGTAATFTISDVYGLQGALPARFRPSAAWLANNQMYNQIRQFDTAGGAMMWERIGADRPALLLGRSAGEAEAMGAAAVTGDHVLVFGDFSHYVIADRVGMAVEFIPTLFHTGNNRPSGQRGWFAYYRVGANVTHPGAFRVLKVA